MSINKKQDTVEEIQGIKVADPYRWLEHSENTEVQIWISEQNKRTDATLKNDLFKKFSGELEKNFKVVNFSNPLPVQGGYFYTERQPDEDQGVLYFKRGLDGVPVMLYNPNGKRDGNTVSIDTWSVSRTGKYIAYSISEDGDEMATLYIKDVATNQELADRITHCRYPLVSWLPDDSAFFYTRNPRPGTVPKNEEHLHTKVYLHRLGDDPDNDELIFGADRPKDDMIGINLSPNGKYLAISVAQSWTENNIYIYNHETQETKTLIESVPSKFYVYFLDDKVLIKTNNKANNYRVLWTAYEGLHKSIDEWKEFIAEKEHLLQSISVTKNKILVEYLVNAHSEVLIFNYEGAELDKLPLPQYSSLAGISGRNEEEEFFYGVDTFIFPKITYQYNPATAQHVEYRKTYNPIYPEKYEIKQEWFQSKDGTRVPVFIFHKKGVVRNGQNPTLLYGYGGFSHNETPGFMRNWVPWIERGGIFVIANIRGGGEFGESWHKGGVKENKQNSFDDFIAAGEYLIVQKYTDQQHLGIIGVSNGGLLVSAVGVQRPDLWKAICSRVPLTDMVRFPLFGIAVRWTHEYGNPEIKEDLQRIMTWSPYHNVKEGTKYPDFFFTTANKDSRVDPLHARKMAAILQNAHKENMALVFTEMEAGHGPGKPVAKMVENQALVLTFFATKLGLKV